MEHAIVIACQMLEHEIRAALRDTGLTCPVTWLERELHNRPDHLREVLQEEIDKAPPGTTVLLAYAQCGNAAVGLEAHSAKLVLPRFADCVHLFRSERVGDPGQVDCRTLYLSPGFLEERSGILKDYDRYCGKWGPEKARRVCRMMVKNYRAVSLMDTHAADLEAYAPRCRDYAELLGLSLERCEGSYRVLCKLFGGQWDEEFVVVPPGGAIDMAAFMGMPRAAGML